MTMTITKIIPLAISMTIFIPMSSAMSMMISPTAMTKFPLMSMTMTMLITMTIPRPLMMTLTPPLPVARPPGDCYQSGGWGGGDCAQRGSVDTEGEDILQVDDGADDDHNDGDQDEDDKDVAPLGADIWDVLQVEGEVLHPD